MKKVRTSPSQARRNAVVEAARQAAAAREADIEAAYAAKKAQDAADKAAVLMSF